MAGQRNLCLLFTNLYGIKSSLCNRPILAVQQYVEVHHKPKKSIQEASDKIKTLNVPEPPKRPLTGYLRFVNEQRENIKKEQPDLPAPQIISRCAELWRNSPESVRDPFITNFKMEWARYMDLKINYLKSLTEDQKQAIEELKTEQKKVKLERNRKKQIKEAGKPKKPPSAYFLFVKDKAQQHPDKSFTNLLVDLRPEWHNLPSDEKDKYLKVIKESLQEYHEKLRKWEERMIEEGHNSLVRKSIFVPKRIKKPIDE